MHKGLTASVKSSESVSDHASCQNLTRGTSPLDMGIPMIPAMKVVQPRRKKSQWKPAGFLGGTCSACAVKLLMFCTL